ncbi:MAG: hypothetical protein AAFN77_18175 [Planctomycetota bacterium]
MLVSLDDGACLECEGQLEVIDVDDCSMLVQCVECEASITVEPDAFGDGCIDYYIPFYAESQMIDLGDPGRE